MMKEKRKKKPEQDAKGLIPPHNENVDSLKKKKN